MKIANKLAKIGSKNIFVFAIVGLVLTTIALASLGISIIPGVPLSLSELKITKDSQSQEYETLSFLIDGNDAYRLAKTATDSEGRVYTTDDEFVVVFKPIETSMVSPINYRGRMTCFNGISQFDYGIDVYDFAGKGAPYAKIVYEVDIKKNGVSVPGFPKTVDIADVNDHLAEGVDVRFQGILPGTAGYPVIVTKDVAVFVDRDVTPNKYYIADSRIWDDVNMRKFVSGLATLPFGVVGAVGSLLGDVCIGNIGTKEIGDTIRSSAYEPSNFWWNRPGVAAHGIKDNQFFWEYNPAIMKGYATLYIDNSKAKFLTYEPSIGIPKIVNFQLKETTSFTEQVITLKNDGSNAGQFDLTFKVISGPCVVSGPDHFTLNGGQSIDYKFATQKTRGDEKCVIEACFSTLLGDKDCSQATTVTSTDTNEDLPGKGILSDIEDQLRSQNCLALGEGYYYDQDEHKCKYSPPIDYMPLLMLIGGGIIVLMFLMMIIVALKK